MNIEPTRPTKAKTTRKPAAAKAKSPAVTTAPPTAQVASTIPATRPGQAVPPAEDIQGLIQKRAYELHCERGYRHGCAIEDWLEAEREILVRRRLE